MGRMNAALLGLLTLGALPGASCSTASSSGQAPPLADLDLAHLASLDGHPVTIAGIAARYDGKDSKGGEVNYLVLPDHTLVFVDLHWSDRYVGTHQELPGVVVVLKADAPDRRDSEQRPYRPYDKICLRGCRRVRG